MSDGWHAPMELPPIGELVLVVVETKMVYSEIFTKAIAFMDRHGNWSLSETSSRLTKNQRVLAWMTLPDNPKWL